MLTKISVLSLVKKIFSVMVLVRATLLHLKQHRYVKFNQMAAAIHFDQFIIKTPAGRWGKPDDLAGAAIFLASDASNFINGHILYVDGGILAYIGKQP